MNQHMCTAPAAAETALSLATRCPCCRTCSCCPCCPWSSPSPAPQVADGSVVLPDGMHKAVRPFIKALFKRHTVCSMANVRQWLQQQGDQQSVAAAALDDQLLHALLMGSGYCQTLRRVYIARDGPHSEAQELRQVRRGCGSGSLACTHVQDAS